MNFKILSYQDFNFMGEIKIFFMSSGLHTRIYQVFGVNIGCKKDLEKMVNLFLQLMQLILVSILPLLWLKGKVADN